MPFTSKNYPVSFQTLRQDLIKKAIEIANRLISQGFTEEVSEMAAIASAKLTSVQIIRLHLLPHPEGWGLVSAIGDIFFIYHSKAEALHKARSKAKTEKLRLYIHSLAGNISDSESFVVNSPRQASHIWEEEYMNLPGPADFVQQRTREAIRRAKIFAQKLQSGLSLPDKENTQLSLDY